MANLKLTDKVIRSLPIGSFKGDVIENLYIKVNASSFSWIYKFTNPQTKGQRLKITLGRYPSLPADVARKIALDYNGLVKQGINPKEYQVEQTKKEEIDAMTFREITALFAEWRADSVKDVNDAIRRVELYIFPKFGDMPLNKIVLSEWHRALKPLENSKNDTLLKICSTSKQILDYAESCGYIASNPLTKLRSSYKKAKAKNNPTIPPEKLPEFMRDLWLSNAEHNTKIMTEFQLLTATRPNEAAKAKWAEIDLKSGIWSLPADKMKASKPHKIVLSSQALALLQRMKEHTGDHEYVFNSTRSKTGHASTQTANNAIKSMHGGRYAGLVTSHGLRAIFSTYMNSLHDALIHREHIEACLAHMVGNGVSRAYNHSDFIEQKRYILQIWGDYIARCKHP